MQHIDNKYSRWYFSLVKKRQQHLLSRNTTYCENHHVVPECLGGSNRKENMVMLTAREHYVAHLLLTKMYVGEAKKKMHYAFYSMRRKKSGMQRYEPNSHIYEILVKKIDRTPSDETLRKMSEAQKRRAPFSVEHLENIRNGVKNSYTPELRAKRTEQFKNQVFTEEHLRNLSIGQRGKKMPASFVEYCKKRRGEKHPRSKHWVLMSPTGEVFTTKAMADFCSSRGLSYSAFRNRSRENNTTPIEKGASKGWCLLSAS